MRFDASVNEYDLMTDTMIITVISHDNEASFEITLGPDKFSIEMRHAPFDIENNQKLAIRVLDTVVKDMLPIDPEDEDDREAAFVLDVSDLHYS